MSDFLQFLAFVVKWTFLGFASALVCMFVWYCVFGDPGKNKCERDLARSQKCVMVWAPESKVVRP